MSALKGRRVNAAQGDATAGDKLVAKGCAPTGMIGVVDKRIGQAVQFLAVDTLPAALGTLAEGLL